MKAKKDVSVFEFFEGPQRRMEQRYQRAQARLNRAAVAWVNAFISGWSIEIERREIKLVNAVRAFEKAGKR